MAFVRAHHAITRSNIDRQTSSNDFDLLDEFAIVYWMLVVIVFAATAFAARRFHQSVEAPQSDAPKQIELPRNLWSMNLLASLGQVSMSHRRGTTQRIHNIPLPITSIITVAMAISQAMALFVMVHDLNPNAHPVTSELQNSWMSTTLTVNCMKWLMVFFLAMDTISGAGQFKTLCTAICLVDANHLSSSRALLLCISCFQYAIDMLVLYCGVNVVLNFQVVSDIVYCGVAMTFITKLDKLFYETLHAVFDIDSTFTVLVDNSGERYLHKHRPHHRRHTLPVRRHHKQAPKEDADLLESQASNVKPQELPFWFDELLCFIVALPMFMAMGFTGRAFYTNTMPNQRLYHAIQNLERLR